MTPSITARILNAVHIDRLFRTEFFQLRRLLVIRRSITTATVIQFVHSFIVIRIDYCNSLLVDLPAYIDRIQLLLNYSARLIYGRGKYDHVAPLLRDSLHWLRVPERVTLKYGLLVYKPRMDKHQAIILTSAS